MPDVEFELSVGDSFLVGEQIFTIIDIDEDHVSIRIDEGHAQNGDCPSQLAQGRPR